MTDHTYQERMLNVLIYIQNHLDDDLSLETLSSVAHFSSFHFHRIFTAYTGESLQSHIRRLRLERATRDLSFSTLSITDIALRAGFDTQQSFHRAFKDTFGETPKIFRENAVPNIFNPIVASNYNETNYPVTIREIDPITVVFQRHVGNYDKIMETWFRLIAEIGMTRFLSDETRKISIAHDAQETTPQGKLRYDACIALPDAESFQLSGALGRQVIQGGQYAVITHHGAVEEIESTYRYLFGCWLPNSDYEPADHPNFLLHRNLPMQTEKNALMTDIYLPITVRCR